MDYLKKEEGNMNQNYVNRYVGKTMMSLKNKVYQHENARTLKDKNGEPFKMYDVRLFLEKAKRDGIKYFFKWMILPYECDEYQNTLDEQKTIMENPSCHKTNRGLNIDLNPLKTLKSVYGQEFDTKIRWRGVYGLYVLEKKIQIPGFLKGSNTWNNIGYGTSRWTI